jgi:hypothetical protein
MAAGRYQSMVRSIGAEQRLHAVGGVGADHQQLAVRHVDDAHDAVGDGQAERAEQQDAAERQAGEGAADVLGNGQPAVDGFHRGDGFVAHLVVRLAGLFGERQQDALDRRRGSFGQFLDGGEARCRISIAQIGLSVSQSQQGLDLPIAFLFQRTGQQGRHLRRDLALQLLRRSKADGHVGYRII